MYRLKKVATMLAITLLLGQPASVFAQDRAELKAEIDSLMKELREKERQLLEPSVEDLATFADFLRQPDTGLTRLMPREKYQGKLLMNGGGAYFSFTRLVHEYGYGSDIELQQNNLMVGFAGADFGFIAKLGDVPLESVTTDHPGVKYLAEFVTPSKEAEAREQYRRAWPGFDVNAITYSRKVESSLNATYVLRSINYRSSDVLVTFRVVRQDSDGSNILLWRILKKYPKPELER